VPLCVIGSNAFQHFKYIAKTFLFFVVVLRFLERLLHLLSFRFTQLVVPISFRTFSYNFAFRTILGYSHVGSISNCGTGSGESVPVNGFRPSFGTGIEFGALSFLACSEWSSRRLAISITNSEPVMTVKETWTTKWNIIANRIEATGFSKMVWCRTAMMIVTSAVVRITGPRKYVMTFIFRIAYFMAVPVVGDA